MSVVGEALFRQDSLDGYLRAQMQAVEAHVRQAVGPTDLSQTNAEIVTRLLPGARVESLQVDFDNPEKNVSEARVRVPDMFSRQLVEINGVRATRSFPFQGSPDLFQLRTDPFSSVLPYGHVSRGRITIGIEGRNDIDAIKGELDRQEQTLREYVDWSRAQTDAHNAQLEGALTAAIARRRQMLAGLDDLKNRI